MLMYEAFEIFPLKSLKHKAACYYLSTGSPSQFGNAKNK